MRNHKKVIKNRIILKTEYMIKKTIGRICALSIMVLSLPIIVCAEKVGVFYDSNVAQIKFAAGDVKAALESKNFTVEMLPLTSLNAKYANKKVVLTLASDKAVTNILTSQGGTIPRDLGQQAYALRTTTVGQIAYWVLGGDVNGAMYGGLQIAENIKFYQFTGTYNNQEAPHILKRGVKLNLPLDEKSFTYQSSNKSTSTKKAIPNVWDMTYWTNWFDEMTRNRYNVISVWNNHPFTSMIKMADYPDVAIQDIKGYDGYFKKMSTDEKIDFWKKVMAYAKSRGFDFYLITWNIFTDGATGKYGITDDKEKAATDEATIKYVRKCISRLLETYPDLDGFGVTQGEHMSKNDSANSAFLGRTYGLGMADYAKNHPERKITFIHRWHLADFTEIKKNFAELLKLPNVTFDMSYKYCKAHMYSTIAPGWMNKSHMKFLIDNNTKSWLTIRNDDFFYHTWGDPDFARAFIEAIPGKGDWFKGFYIGSDGYSPTRTFFSKNSVSQGLLEVQRQWYMNLIWGRLAYNPATSDDVFKNYMALKFPEVSPENLFTAWKKASGGVQKATELVHGSLIRDHQWWPEACQSDEGFVTVSEFSNCKPAPGSTICSIEKTAFNSCGNSKNAYMLADEIEADAIAALSIIKTMSAAPNTELDLAINNIKTLSYLSVYYAWKIRGATYLMANDMGKAKNALGSAYCWWMNYSNLMDKMYTGMDMQRSANLPNWHANDQSVLKEYTDLGGTGTSSCEVENQRIDEKYKTKR